MPELRAKSEAALPLRPAPPSPSPLPLGPLARRPRAARSAMADAAPMAIFRDLCSSLLPVVVVNASEDAEAVCLKNGLTFADMIA